MTTLLVVTYKQGHVGCGGQSTEKEEEAAIDMQLVATEEEEEVEGREGERGDGGNSLSACVLGRWLCCLAR